MVRRRGRRNFFVESFNSRLRDEGLNDLVADDHSRPSATRDQTGIGRQAIYSRGAAAFVRDLTGEICSLGALLAARIPYGGHPFPLKSAQVADSARLILGH